MITLLVAACVLSGFTPAPAMLALSHPGVARFARPAGSAEIPLNSFGTSPVTPAASRMKNDFSAGMRSTIPSPTSRIKRSTSDSFENSRLSPSVASPIVAVSKRRQR